VGVSPTIFRLLEEPQPFLTDQPLKYDPTGEWIFPSLFDTREHIPDAPARWLLAYSPHDAPGGICIAWGDAIDGPWREHEPNPVIGHVWDGHYDVSHVASPHLIWMRDQQRLACYFHGENTTTRVAFSDDGISWSDTQIVMSADRVPGWTLDECSYARVFEHTLPSEPSSRYVMFFMGKQPEAGAHAGGTRHLFLAWSADGLSWTPREHPVVSPPQGWQASGPQLVRLSGKLFLLHHFDIQNAEGHLFSSPLDEDCQLVGETARILSAGDRPEAGGRLADPLLVEADGESHLIWLEGARLDGRFVRARVAFEA